MNISDVTADWQLPFLNPAQENMSSSAVPIFWLPILPKSLSEKSLLLGIARVSHIIINKEINKNIYDSIAKVPLNHVERCNVFIKCRMQKDC
jgi:hypothetical protein